MTNDIINRKEIRTIRYNRVSSRFQYLDRQQKNNEKYTYVFEDKCSGTITLFERDACFIIFALAIVLN